MRAETPIEDMFDCRVINLTRHPQRFKRFCEQNEGFGAKPLRARDTLSYLRTMPCFAVISAMSCRR
jgi:hypothetical protein